MNHLLSEGSILIRSLGWTLLHSLWQGALVSACAWVLLRTVAHARIKYHVLLSSLTVLAGWFVVTWIQQWQRLQAITVHVTAATRDSGVEKSYTISTIPPQSSAELWMHKLMPDMEHAFPWLVGLYAIGLCLMLLRFGFGITRLLQIRYQGIITPDSDWAARMEHLQDRLGVSRKVKLFFSSRVNMPMMLGALKPVILLPIATIAQLDTAQVEAILLHELAHIKRQDYLINIVQIVIETLLFFNPFMWWISAGIRREREHCCDDLVLSQTQRPLSYATALAALEAYRNASIPLAMAAGGQKKHYLFNRIKRMTEMKKNPLNYGRLAAGVVIVSMLTCSVIWLTPAFAQSKKDKTTSKTTTTQKIIIVDDKGTRKEYSSIEELPSEERNKLRESLDKLDGNLSKLDESLSNEDDVAYIPVPEPSMPPSPGIAPQAIPEPVPVPDIPEPVPAVPPIPPIPPVNYSQIAKNAINAVDWNKIHRETRLAMIDADKAGKEVERAMKNVDWKQVDRDVQQAMKEIDKINWDEVAAASGNGKDGARMKKQIRVQLEEAHNARREAFEAAREAREEAMKAGQEAREEAMRAREEALNESREASREAACVARENAREASRAARDAAREARNAPRSYEHMLDEMEADGLIDRDRGFSIDKNSADLRINGKNQPDNVKVKYRHYFTPGKVQINGSRGSLSISSTNES